MGSCCRRRAIYLFHSFGFFIFAFRWIEHTEKTHERPRLWSVPPTVTPRMCVSTVVRTFLRWLLFCCFFFFFGFDLNLARLSTFLPLLCFIFCVLFLFWASFLLSSLIFAYVMKRRLHCRNSCNSHVF